jgi:pyruvate ferredoxin oxidoreductase alpha subunit
MGRVVALTGNSAAAEAIRQIHPDVCAAYPITPSTQIMEEFSQHIADGQVQTELVSVESEHSAMSACVGAAAAGGRVMTATSANGLALMWEILYIASGMRLPMVMAVVNRALSGPLNIHGDHSDTMGARDTGWIQLFSENAQEAYDNLIMGFPIAEQMDVRLPVLVTMDGFIISHSIERMELLEDKEVQDFIGQHEALYPLLDVENPVTHGPVDLQDYYTEHKRQQVEAMRHAKDVIIDVSQRFQDRFGRSYSFFDSYRLDDAELAVVVLGSACGTARQTVDELRKEGVAAGMMKLRVFRPFPTKEVAAALGHCKAVGILDRSDSFGANGGPVFHEVRSSLYDVPDRPKIINRIFGLGGRDVGVGDFKRVFSELTRLAEGGDYDKIYDYLTVREGQPVESPA